MAYGSMTNAVQYLQNIGFLDLIIPFILFFAIFFAILQRINIFQRNGQPDRKLNTIISAALALAIVLPHAAGVVPTNYDPIILLNSILPSAGITILIALLAIILIGFTGGAGFTTPNLLSSLVGIASLIALVLIALYAVFPNSAPLQFLKDPVLQSVIVVLAVLGLVVWFVMSPERPERTWTQSFQNWYRTFAPPANRPPQPPNQ
ncbi:hypothetical protein HY486_02765 [Candidatus Woesearchaeota archaeon]|nr:hypothetical protein [Candidatus Woesearchaeota archaeon]